MLPVIALVQAGPSFSPIRTRLQPSPLYPWRTHPFSLLGQWQPITICSSNILLCWSVTSVLSTGSPHLEVPSAAPQLHISRPKDPSPSLNQPPLLVSPLLLAGPPSCDSSFPQAPHPFYRVPLVLPSLPFPKPPPQPRFVESHTYVNHSNIPL